jgi:hypothetical protein
MTFDPIRDLYTRPRRLPSPPSSIEVWRDLATAIAIAAYGLAIVLAVCVGAR